MLTCTQGIDRARDRGEVSLPAAAPCTIVNATFELSFAAHALNIAGSASEAGCLGENVVVAGLL